MDRYKILEQMGLELPKPPAKGGLYAPCKRFMNSLYYVSGCGPSVGGKYIAGKLGREIGLFEGKDHALNCMLNVLAVLEREIGTLNREIIPVKLLVFVASENDFSDQPEVANGASELLKQLFGEENLPARSAIGVNVLPGDIPVEVEALFEVP